MVAILVVLTPEGRMPRINECPIRYPRSDGAFYFPGPSLKCTAGPNVARHLLRVDGRFPRGAQAFLLGDALACGPHWGPSAFFEHVEGPARHLYRSDACRTARSGDCAAARDHKALEDAALGFVLALFGIGIWALR